MNAIKIFFLIWVAVFIGYGTAVMAGAWVGMAYVSYTETVNIFIKKEPK